MDRAHYPDLGRLEFRAGQIVRILPHVRYRTVFQNSTVTGKGQEIKFLGGEIGEIVYIFDAGSDVGFHVKFENAAGEDCYKDFAADELEALDDE